jgi:hypothetical protein
MPSLCQRKVNGPVPLGVVENETLSPGQLVWLVSKVADVFVLMVSVAELVTLLQLPETITEYIPALVGTTETRFKVALVSPLSVIPSLRQTKVNDPVPLGVVEKETLSPGQLVKLVNKVADVFVLMVSVAELVTLLQLPETITEYIPALVATTETKSRDALV